MYLPGPLLTDRFSHETIAGSARLAGGRKPLDEGMRPFSCIARRAVSRSRPVFGQGGMNRGHADTGIGVADPLLDKLDKGSNPPRHIRTRRVEQPDGVIKVRGRRLMVREQVDQSAS